MRIKLNYSYYIVDNEMLSGLLKIDYVVTIIKVSRKSNTVNESVQY